MIWFYAMPRRLALPLLCAIVMLGRSLPAVSAEQEPRDATVAASMRSALRETGLPGMTFAVYGARLRKSYAEGLADRETRQRMRNDSLMMGGSTGKMLAAALIYQEVQEGRLRLDDKVSKYLGTDADFGKLPGAADFTIAMLLSHSSGLVDGAVDYAAMEDSSGTWSSDRRFRAAQNTRLLWAPGTRYSYSDLNYQILAAVLESIEAKSFEQLATGKILLPLEMKHTVPALIPTIPGLASGYAGPTSKPQYEGIHLPDKTAEASTLFMNPAFEGGGGGFATCSADMAKFIYALFNGRLIDASQLAHMNGVHPVLQIHTDGARVAAGVFSFDTALGEAFGHPGIWFGYKTLVAYYPSLGIGAAMQVNSQIDATGADLEVFRIEGKEFSMIGVLTELVRESVGAPRGLER